MAEHIISRFEAKTQGLKRYFTGEPCCRGHLAERITSSYACLLCFRERERLRRGADPEAERERQREWRSKNPGAAKARSRRYRTSNRGRLNQKVRIERAVLGERRDARLRRRREIREKRPKARLTASELKRRRALRIKRYENVNFESVAKYRKAWRLSNQDRLYAYNHRRRALKKNSSGAYTAAEARAILLAQSYRCAYCDADLRKVRRHLDHVVPISRGGRNDRANLQYLCQPCNLSKGAKHPIDFARELGLLL